MYIYTYQDWFFRLINNASDHKWKTFQLKRTYRAINKEEKKLQASNYAPFRRRKHRFKQTETKNNRTETHIYNI